MFYEITMHFIYDRALLSMREVFMVKLTQIARFFRMVCLEEFTKDCVIQSINQCYLLMPTPEDLSRYLLLLRAEKQILVRMELEHNPGTSAPGILAEVKISALLV